MHILEYLKYVQVDGLAVAVTEEVCKNFVKSYRAKGKNRYDE